MKEIILTRGGYAQVDDEDFAALSKHRWYLHGRGYAARDVVVDGKRTVIRMHNVVLPPPDGFEVDHINGRKADNQRENLRTCTHAQNSRNKGTMRGARFKGFSRHKQSGKWAAEIRINRVKIHLGLFATERNAALAYDKAARQHFGEFARLNYPDESAA